MPNKSPDERAPTDSSAIKPIESTQSPAPSLSSTQRRELRAQAHHIDPVVMIGDSGLTRSVLAEIGRALESHQLIKVRVLGDDREERARVMERICSVLGSAPVQMIGKLLVLWRPAAEKAQTPKRTLSKKQAAQALERPQAVKSPARGPKRAPAQANRGTGTPDGQRPGSRSRTSDTARSVVRSRSADSPGRASTGSAKPRSQSGSAQPRSAGTSSQSRSAQGPAKPPSAFGPSKARSSSGPAKPRSKTGAGPSRSAGPSSGPRGTRTPSTARSRPTSAGRPAARKRGSHS